MLTIRSKQMAALRRAALSPVHARLIARLRGRLASATIRYADPALLERCDVGIDLGHRHGIRTERNVYVVVAAVIVLGEDFDSDPASAWAGRILTDRYTHEDVKARLLILRTLLATGVDISPDGH